MDRRSAGRFGALALVALLGWAPVALAQASDAGDAGDLADAGDDAGAQLPDGSVGEGCADCEGQGDDTTGHVVSTCEFSTDCTRGFVCNAGRCEWRHYIDASGGFCGVASVLMLVGGAFWLGRRRA